MHTQAQQALDRLLSVRIVNCEFKHDELEIACVGLQIFFYEISLTRTPTKR